MSGIKVQKAVEQMSGMVDRYLQGDFDHFTHDEISDDIKFLKGIQNEYSGDDEGDEDMDVLLGSVKTVVSHLYVSRGYATDEIPRDFDYYNHMGEAKEKFRIISKLTR